MAFHLLVSEEDARAFAPEELNHLTRLYSQAYPNLQIEAEVILLSLGEIQELNREHRQLDEPTDVLSFPTLPSFAEIKKEAAQGSLLLGSIVISPDKATLYKERLIDLSHHGLLHLLGFDHEQDRVEWEREEQRLLSLAAERGFTLTGIPDDQVQLQ